MVKNTDMENLSYQQIKFIKACLILVLNMDSVNKFLKMVILIKDNIYKVYSLEREYIDGQTDQYIMVNLYAVRETEKVNGEKMNLNKVIVMKVNF